MTLLRNLFMNTLSVTDKTDKNKMTTNNIALVFGPTMLRSPLSVMDDMQHNASYIQVFMVYQ